MMGNECPFIMKADTCGLWHWHNGNEPMFGRVCSPGINEHRACQQEKEREEAKDKRRASILMEGYDFERKDETGCTFVKGERTGPADRRVNEQPTTGSVRRNGRDAFYLCNDHRKSRGRRKGD